MNDQGNALPDRPNRHRRRLLAGAALAAPFPTRAVLTAAALFPTFSIGAAAVGRVGLLIAETATDQATRLDALKAGLRDLGYTDGRNIVFELKTADGDYARLPALARELVQARVDLIVPFGIKALVAAREATTTIPIVIPSTSSDLVAMGLVASYGRHGGNITGSMALGPEIMAERLELLKEVAPRVQRVAVLVNPANTSFAPTQRRMEASAGPLRIALVRQDVRAPEAIGAAFAAMAQARADALVVQDDTLLAAHAAAIAERAIGQRWPSVGPEAYVAAGGLLGFGSSDIGAYRRGAYFVDRILRGTRPGDLPIERASRFVLAINLRTARALGLSVPNAVRIRADEVIG